MANAQNLEVTLDMVVRNQGDIAKLAASVKKVEAELRRLQAASNGVTQATGKVVQNGRAYNNMADAQSRSLRQQRQGFQQVGMQINDFATSISTGASVTTAFNQQIGQLGYAMSLMTGKVGAAGRFLAGPWGAAVTIAVMGLGQLYDRFIDNADAAEEARLANMDFSREVEFSAMSLDGFTAAVGRLNDKTRQAINLQVSLGRSLVMNAKLANIDAQRRLKEAQARAEEAQPSGLFDFFMPQSARLRAAEAEADLKKIANQARETEKALQMAEVVAGQERVMEALDANLRVTRQYDQKIADLKARREATIEDEIGAVNRGIYTTQQAYEAELLSLEKGKRAAQEKAKAVDRAGGSTRRAGRAARVSKERFDAFTRALAAAAGVGNEVAASVLKDVNKIADAQQKLADTEAVTKVLYESGNITLRQRADAIKAVREELEALTKVEREIKATQRGGESLVGDLDLIKITTPLEQFNEAAKVVQESARSIGNAVSDAFFQMITSASSWKDAMAGLIRSVIAELWRLYVVQQIVGFITKAIGGGGAPGAGGGILGGLSENLPGRARGGSVTANTPYVVGEKGPELFMPNQSGTIIPRHNLGEQRGGSGVTVHVDARGSADPAAVRAQVERGILEAAPAIIAASEARTIKTLRRPRLAGGMV